VKLPRLAFLAIAVGAVACAPRLGPLTGAPVPARIPKAELRPGHWKIVFNWVLNDQLMSGRGDGVARIASPDSVRLDFFLAGGVGAGAAVLIGNDVRTPGSDMVRRIVPGAPLLWAALGRAAVPQASDTVARLDGSTLRLDLGRPTAWRLTFNGDTIVRLERVNDGRVAEWVVRRDSAHISYRQEGARRSLDLVVTRVDSVSEFDASIWSLPR